MSGRAKQSRILVLGAGPAGLGVAWRLARRGFDVSVFERAPHVGGNAGSFDLAGQMVDFGSHRLHPACPEEVLGDIRAMLGADLLSRPRHGRIRLRGRWIGFPLSAPDLALHAPPSFVAGALRDAVRKPKSGYQEQTFAAVLEAGLGRTICRDFYFPYARKIWGLEPELLDGEQARRRVSANSTGKLIQKVLRPKPKAFFYYPRGGFGRISRAYDEAAREAGARVLTGESVAAVDLSSSEGPSVEVAEAGGTRRYSGDLTLSTIPLTALIRLIRPAPPRPLLDAAAALRYRAMVLVYLVLESERFTEFDAHYFPSEKIAITRLSEPKNYGLSGVPGQTVLCAELPCDTSDPVWNSSDDELAKLTLDSLATAEVPCRAEIKRIAVRRLPRAYPVYAAGYSKHFEQIDRWLDSASGVVTLGRQGLFVHDNTHHTLAMAYAAADCVDDRGGFDRNRWAESRRAFESFVVED